MEHGRVPGAPGVGDRVARPIAGGVDGPPDRLGAPDVGPTPGGVAWPRHAP